MKLTKLDLEILKKAKRAEGEPLLVTEAGVEAATLFARAVTDLAAAQGLLVRIFRAYLDGEHLETDGPSLCGTCARDDPEGCTCNPVETWLTWDGKVLACQNYRRREQEDPDHTGTEEDHTLKTREQRRARRRAVGNAAYTTVLLLCIVLLLWRLVM